MASKKNPDTSPDYLDRIQKAGLDPDYLNAWCVVQALLGPNFPKDIRNTIGVCVAYYEEYLYCTWRPGSAKQIFLVSNQNRVEAINLLVEEWNALSEKTHERFEGFLERAQAIIYQE
jgi:hypothetical protein